MQPEIGNIVKVINPQEQYSCYYQWAKRYNLYNYIPIRSAGWIPLQHFINKENLFKIIAIGEHSESQPTDIILGIEHIQSKRHFMISKKGIYIKKKVENK